ncbi:MAG: IS110 family transposase [Clostridia bacterium]|nr:IS110 family transposase [Clostridia bacterium]
MFYVGIDIAKNTHWASVMSSDGEVVFEPFSFSNDNSGFQKFVSKLDSLDKEKILIGLESTAHYGENIISYLFNLNFKIGLINPIQTANLRRSNIRKTKNDKVDTYIIIKALTLGNYSPITSRDINNLKLKGLCRSRRNLVTLRNKAKIQLVSYMDQIFLELAQFFKGNLHLNVSYQLLKEFSSPKTIKDIHLTKLTNILHDNSHGRYGKQDAIRLRELAKSSVGIDNPSLSLQVKHAILQIELYDEQIAEVEALYKSILDELDSPILTIPGMSYNQAAVIVGSIGDINRFEHSCQLLAYAGLDPSVIQSGNFQARSTRMSKRGSGMFRYSLVYSAHNIVRNNKTFRDYYELKRSQGKSHYCALGHVAHKLVRVIFKMLKDNVAFNLD